MPRRGPQPRRPAVTGLLTVVTGPPCAGKSTYVREQAGPDDLVVDLDRIAEAFGYGEPQIVWDDDHPAVTAARMARAHVVHGLLSGRLLAKAWVIEALPPRSMEAQYQRAGAGFVTIDPGRGVCESRAERRHPSTLDGIARWYAAQPGAADALGVFG